MNQSVRLTHGQIFKTHPPEHAEKAALQKLALVIEGIEISGSSQFEVKDMVRRAFRGRALHIEVLRISPENGEEKQQEGE